MVTETITHEEYIAEYNSDLGGYILTFKDGNEAQTQTCTETNKLHADFGDTYIERYSEYDSDLSDKQDALTDKFVADINKRIKNGKK